MSEDKREDILVRIEAILSANKTEGFKVYRNRAALEENDLPAYVLLDGGEEKQKGSDDRRAPILMLMTPQIFYVPLPPENRTNDGIGPQMSEERSKLIKAIR